MLLHIRHNSKLTNTVYIEPGFLYPREPTPTPEVGESWSGGTQHRNSQPLTEARLPFSLPEGGSNAAFQDGALCGSPGRVRMR